MFFDSPIDPRPLPPLQGLLALQEHFGRWFSEPGPGRSTPMAFALFTRDEGLLLRTPLPGVAPQDITLEVDGNALTLAGQFALEPESENAQAQHLERPRGRFARTLRLPFEVDATRVAARLERGLLEVELPRLQKTPPTKIQVLTAAKRN